MRNFIQEYMVSSQYFAPRGKERLMFLGEQISHRHINYDDKIIGIVGDAGAGKSSLIKGMFPGLQLSNDDDIVNPRKIMQVRNSLTDVEDATTFHLDIRFQMAFTQMYEIVDFVNSLLERNRRVVIEHFNLLFPYLHRNADVIVGIGEEIIVTRPSLFGPHPGSVYEIVHSSLQYRKMAHSAEEVATTLLEEVFGITESEYFFSDIRNGFLIKFYKKPNIDLSYLSDLIDKKIAENMDISYYDEDHIIMGGKIIPCDGPRFHVKNTSEIKDFTLVNDFVHDPKTNTYCMIGLVDNYKGDLGNRNTHYFLTRKSVDEKGKIR